MRRASSVARPLRLVYFWGASSVGKHEDCVWEQAAPNPWVLEGSSLRWRLKIATSEVIKTSLKRGCVKRVRFCYNPPDDTTRGRHHRLRTPKQMCPGGHKKFEPSKTACCLECMTAKMCYV